MPKMSSPADHGTGDLRQRLEILRVQGGRHRLELALTVETLVQETGGMRRVAGRVFSVLGMVGGKGLGKGLMRTVLRGLVPVVLSLFAGSRVARSAGQMRTTLEIGALGLIIYRGVKRALRKSDTQTRKQAPTGAHEGDATGSD
jgi:hypothetical protein